MPDTRSIVAALVGLSALGLVGNLSRWGLLGRDSGMFAYAGTLLLAGQAPYEHVWDHKPPAIHYINALGLLIGGGNEIGIRAIELVVLASAAVVGFWTLEQVLGRRASLFASLAWLVTLPALLEGGNLPEEYALAAQFAALAMYVLLRRRPPTWWPWFVIGAAGAVAAMLKPNLIAIWAAIYIHHFASQGRRFSVLRPVTIGAVGALVATVPIMAHLWISGAMPEMLDAVLTYNYWYQANAAGDRLDALAHGVAALSLSSLLLPIAGLAYVRLLASWLRDRPAFHSSQPLGGIALVAFPLEVGLSALPGYSFAHYYMAWLPVLSILAGIFARDLTQGLRMRIGLPAAVRDRTVLVSLVIAMSVGSLATMASLRTYTEPADLARLAALRLIAESTQPCDAVLVWGAEAGLNVQSGRRAPTRLVYQFALFTRNYQSPALSEEFINGVEATPPRLIIDASSEVRAMQPPLDQSSRDGWAPGRGYGPAPGLEPFYAMVRSAYDSARLGATQWRVYTHRSLPDCAT